MANDLWRTPPEVINWVQDRFGKIDIDLCSSDEDKICDRHLTEQDNFLDDCWIEYGSDMRSIYTGDLAWCNPPYSDPLPFVMQCAEWGRSGNGVVMLLNFDPSTKWFDVISSKASVIIPIQGGRIAFLNEEGKPVRGNSKPQMLCYFAPFGRATKQAVYEPVNIKEIYNER